jgi:penicillin-binding protein 2
MRNYFTSVDPEWFRRRLFGFVAVSVLALSLLTLRLFDLQVIHGKDYVKLCKNNCIRIHRIKPCRGLIFDRNGRLLVENRPSFDLSIVKNDAAPLTRTVETLSRHIGLPVNGIMEKINTGQAFAGGFQPILIKEDIGRDTLALILSRRFELPGVLVECNAKRNYVHQQLAVHLIGYLGEISAPELSSGKYQQNRGGDYIGRFGIEKAHENELSGKPGGKIVQVNANGQVIEVLDTVPPVPGCNIFLTIDEQLQKKTEELLEGKTGAALAMDPGSGEILAMASSPGFDPNLFISGISRKQWQALISNPDRPLMNKAVQGEYPPASTYKIVTAIAGLEEGIIDQDTTVYCSGSYTYGNRSYGCWKPQGHGRIRLVRAIAESCDIYFYSLGKRLGVDRLAWYAKGCALGSPTGIHLDMESDGLIPTAEWKKKYRGVPWQAGENLSIAIGQGYNLVTPLQMLVLISAAANGGEVYRPMIVKSIRTVEGEVVRRGMPESTGRIPASSKTLTTIREGLLAAVNDPHGTARYTVHVEGLAIAGKTGTAQVVSRKHEAPEHAQNEDPITQPHAWFVGYAPADSPEIAVSVLVEHGGHGSSEAGPVAKEMITTFLKGMVENQNNDK